MRIANVLQTIPTASLTNIIVVTKPPRVSTLQSKTTSSIQPLYVISRDHQHHHDTLQPRPLVQMQRNPIHQHHRSGTPQTPSHWRTIVDPNDRDGWTEEQMRAHAEFVQAVNQALERQDMRERIAQSRPARL